MVKPNSDETSRNQQADKRSYNESGYLGRVVVAMALVLVFLFVFVVVLIGSLLIHDRGFLLVTLPLFCLLATWLLSKSSAGRGFLLKYAGVLDLDNSTDSYAVGTQLKLWSALTAVSFVIIGAVSVHAFWANKNDLEKRIRARAAGTLDCPADVLEVQDIRLSCESSTDIKYLIRVRGCGNTTAVLVSGNPGAPGLGDSKACALYPPGMYSGPFGTRQALLRAAGFSKSHVWGEDLSNCRLRTLPPEAGPPKCYAPYSHDHGF